MDKKIHFAYILAGILAAVAYVVLLVVLYVSRYCMRKCPACITGRRPQRPTGSNKYQLFIAIKLVKINKFLANPQNPQQSGRRVIVMTTQDLKAQGIMVPNVEVHPEMIPGNLNSPMPPQQMAQFNGHNGLVGNSQNFLTQEKICQNNVEYPGNFHQPMYADGVAPMV